MTDDIKSMIKSRRDERYYRSAFEKRDPRLDDVRYHAADARIDGNVDNDDVMSPKEYDRAYKDAHRTYEQADQGWNPNQRRSPSWGDDSRLSAPDHDEALGENRRVDSRNIGIPKKQPTREEIPGNARQYADRLDNELSYDDLDDNRQALLDGGYTEDDLRKFEEIYERLQHTKNKTKYDAVDNARRIEHMQAGGGAR
jgi:hypothetical protein